MTLDVALVVVGAAVVGLGLFADALKRLWLSLPLVALVAGVLLGPQVLGVLDPDRVGDEYRLLEELARLTLAISLTSTALQFSRADLREVRRLATVLLTVVMAGMWVVTGLGAWLLLDVPFWVGALVGAILTPTDPVVASSLVTGRLAEDNLPRRLRRALQLEAGANDGLALVFVLLPALVISLPGGEVGTWAGEVAKEVGLALGVGAAVGAAAGALLRFSLSRETLEDTSFYAAALGLALLALGATHLLGGSGILAAFVAGLTFSLVIDREHAERIQEAQGGVERVLLVAFFLAFGALLPWSGWVDLGWPGLLFALWAVLLRRAPVAVPALALLPIRLGRRDAAFLGWFGPLGVAAVYYALFVERYGPERYGAIFAAATLAIALSVLVQTLTATPAVRRHGGRSPWTTLRHPLRREVDEAP